MGSASPSFTTNVQSRQPTCSQATHRGAPVGQGNVQASHNAHKRGSMNWAQRLPSSAPSSHHPVFQYTQPSEDLNWRLINALDCQLQSGTAAVATLAESSVLDHLCCAILEEKQLLNARTSTPAALQLFRVLQAVAQCCVDMHGRYVRATAHVALLTQCQLDFIPCLKAYEAALQQRYRDYHNSLAVGVRTATQRDIEQLREQQSPVRSLPALRMQVAAHQQASLAAAAAARHADDGLKGQLWRQPQLFPLDWQAVSNLHPTQDGAPEAKKTRARNAASSPVGTACHFHRALTAIIAGDPSSVQRAEIFRVPGNQQQELLDKAAGARLVSVTQAALQWAVWRLRGQEAAWQTACTGREEHAHTIDACIRSIGHLERSLAQMHVEIQKLPEGTQSSGSHSNLHLLRAALRDTSCINDPHPPRRSAAPGLGMPSSQISAWKHGASSAEAISDARKHAIDRSMYETLGTISKIQAMQTGAKSFKAPVDSDQGQVP